MAELVYAHVSEACLARGGSSTLPMPTMEKYKEWLYEFIVFGLKEAQSCIFAGSFFFLLFVSKYLPLFGLARYDFLFIAAVLLQVILYLTKVETWDEVKTIFVFHLLGFALETFKTHPSVGSWNYPEEGLFVIGTVPLFAGFMYAAVGSYIMQAWRILKLQLIDPPNYTLTVVLSVAIYLNFFTNYFIPDLRLILIPAVFLLFARTSVQFIVTDKIREMPLALAFCLIAFFIWLAENISTFLGAWKYPDQIHVWNVVSTNKITSWFLLVIISFILVYTLKHLKYDILRWKSDKPA